MTRRGIAAGIGATLGVSLLGVATAHAATFADAASSGMASAFLFAFTAGLLTALTPCVYPMIPITISIFGGKGVPRARALLLATLYVAGIAVMFGTLGTVFALVGKAFGSFLANPWVIVPLALFFALMAVSMFGAFELALPSCAAGAAQPRRRPQRRRRVSDGARRRADRGALHRAAPGGHPGVRRDDAERVHRLLLARDVRDRDRRSVLGDRRVLHAAAEVGRLDGGGQERVRDRAARGRALLPQERGAPARPLHRPNADVPGDRGGAGRGRHRDRRRPPHVPRRAGRRRCGRAPASRWR